MKCPSCGSENFEGAGFCSLCLTAFGPVNAAEPPDAFSTNADPVQSVTSPIEPRMQEVAREPALNADEYVSGMFVEQRLDAAARRPARGLRIPLLGDTPVSFTGLRFMAGGVVFVVLILGWILSGGLGQAKAAEIAQVPVPVGSKLVATHEGITAGQLGELDEERRAVYATRTFVVPKPLGEVMAYYRTGGTGANTLFSAGWGSPGGEYTAEETFFDGEWMRIATMGYRAEEEQGILIRVQEKSLGWGIFEWGGAPGRDPFPTLEPTIADQIVPGQSCVVMICCIGPSLQEIEYPEY